MRGNAVLAHAEYGVSAVEAVERIAAGSGLSSIARRVNISEIHAARSLEDIAGKGGHIPQLCGGAREDRFRQHRVALTHDWMPCQLTVGDIRADRDPIIRHIDARHAEMANTNYSVRREHIDLHQIDKRRPTSQEHCTWATGYGSRRVLRGGQPLKGEVLHGRASSASICLTAATMFA